MNSAALSSSGIVLSFRDDHRCSPNSRRRSTPCVPGCPTCACRGRSASVAFLLEVEQAYLAKWCTERSTKLRRALGNSERGCNNQTKEEGGRGGDDEVIGRRGEVVEDDPGGEEGNDIEEGGGG